MKSFIVIIKGLSFFFTVIFAILFCLGWLFNFNVDRINIVLTYTSFTYLVSWFINLLFLKE